MIKSYFTTQIEANFPFEPTSEQRFAIIKIADFLFSQENDSAFLLKGFAGTGKTSLVGALVKTMDELKQKTVLLAPTGRAAKVFASYAKHPAFTIHRKIYRQKQFNADGGCFLLNQNLAKNTLFIVDEASMISNEVTGDIFGSGHLLDDLIQFVRSGENCRLMVVGDVAQLPPIGDELSPALEKNVLEMYGLQMEEMNLSQIVRQSAQSGILFNATRLRQMINDDNCFCLPKIKVSGFPDVKAISGNELIEKLEHCYYHDGREETIVITRSNKRANIYNNGIRVSILDREEELESGDWLMIARNNYFWTEKEIQLDFLANGEICEVKRVRNIRELYGFHFADVTLRMPDYNDYELTATVLLDTLHSESPSLTKAESEKLFEQVQEDYADITVKTERLKKIKQDPFYNALQMKYAYAITCHKAQGGQWKNVFLDQGYMTDELLSPDYFRWLYTAITRTTGTLYLVNYPKDEIE